MFPDGFVGYMGPGNQLQSRQRLDRCVHTFAKSIVSSASFLRRSLLSIAVSDAPAIRQLDR